MQSPDEGEPLMKRAKIEPKAVLPPSKDEEERKAEMVSFKLKYCPPSLLCNC